MRPSKEDVERALWGALGSIDEYPKVLAAEVRALREELEAVRARGRRLGESNDSYARRLKKLDQG